MKDNLLKEYNAFEIIMFVHELHSMGYEQLRLYAGMSPNGLCWRWYIYPKILMKLDNSFEHNSDMIPFCCLQGSTSDDEPIKKSLLQTNEIIGQYRNLHWINNNAINLIIVEAVFALLFTSITLFIFIECFENKNLAHSKSNASLSFPFFKINIYVI